MKDEEKFNYLNFSKIIFNFIALLFSLLFTNKTKVSVILEFYETSETVLKAIDFTINIHKSNFHYPAWKEQKAKTNRPNLNL